MSPSYKQVELPHPASHTACNQGSFSSYRGIGPTLLQPHCMCRNGLLQNSMYISVSLVQFRINQVDTNPNSKLPLIQQPRQKRWAACGSAGELLPEARFKCQGQLQIRVRANYVYSGTDLQSLNLTKSVQNSFLNRTIFCIYK